MADDQSVATDQQDTAVVVTHHRRVAVSSVKRLGFYSQSEVSKLRRLFTELLAALNTENIGYYELYNNKKITEVRLENRGAVALTTDKGFPDDSDSPGTLLFFTDWVALLLDIAALLQEHYPTERLKYLLFPKRDTQAWLKDWGEAEEDKISQGALQYESAQDVIELLSNLSSTFDQLAEEGTVVEEATDEEAVTDDLTAEQLQEIQKELDLQNMRSSANVVPAPSPVSEAAAASSSDNNYFGPNPFDENGQIDRYDEFVQKRIGMEAKWVFNAARVNLLQQLIDSAGINFTDLTPELQQQLTQLEDSMRTELFRIIDGLSDAELQQLFNHSFRTKLYHQLLQDLLTDQSNIFYRDLLKFYKKFTKRVVEVAEPAEQEAALNRLKNSFHGPESVGTRELKQIHSEVQLWITELRQEFLSTSTEGEADTAGEAEQQATEAVAETAKQAAEPSLEEVLTQGDTQLLHSAAPVKNAYSSVQQAQLNDSFATAVSLPPAEQKSLQNQSARLVWGAAAEIFGDTTGIPPQLIDQISGHAVTYLLSRLSPDELRQLAKSPSSLLRHIKEVARRVQEDVRFQDAAQQFTQFRDVPDGSRSQLIENEVAAGYQTVVAELFYKNGITETQVSQDAALKQQFETITQFIRDELYTELSQLSYKELQQLASDPAAQKRFLARFEQSLIRGNPQLARLVGAFFTAYIAELAQAGRGTEADSVKSAQSVLIEAAGDLSYTESPAERREQENQDAAEAQAAAAHTSRQASQTSAPHSPTATSSGENDPTLVDTNTPSVRKKKDILNDLLVAEWRQLNTDEKIVVYDLYDYPIPRKFRQPNPDLQLFNEYFVLVPEFLQVKRKELPYLVDLMKHPPKEGGELQLDPAFSEKNVAQLRQEKQISESALQAQLEIQREQMDPEHFERLQEYLNLKEEERQTILAEVIAARRQEFAELALAYNVELEQLAEEDAFLQELQVFHALQSAAEIGAATGDFGEDPGAYFEQAGGGAQGGGAGRFFSRFRSKKSVAGEAAKATTEATKEELQKKLLSRFTPSKETFTKKGLQELGGKALGAFTAGASALLLGGAKLLYDQRARDEFVKYAQYGLALLLQAFSNVAGLGTFLAVSGALAFTPLAFMAIPAGLIAGSMAAALFPEAPSLLGIRTPPAPWSELSNNGPGLRELRGQSAQTAATQQAAQAEAQATADAAEAQANGNSSTQRGGNSNSSSGQNADGSLNQTSGTAAASTIPASWALAIPLWVATPIGTFLLVMIASWSVFLAIMGAFIAPVPTRLSDYVGADTIGTPTQSQYVDITKIAGPSEIENLGSGETATITYTVIIQPKGEYSLQINSIKDTMSGFGEVVPDLSALNNTVDASTLPSDRITDPITFSYTVPITGTVTDALINNTIIFSFTIYDAYDFEVKQNETVTAVGNLRVGDPTVGCWPTDGNIWQLPFGQYYNFSHSNLDAYDIGDSSTPEGTVGNPIYATFPGELCDKGKTSGGYGRHASLKFTIGEGANAKTLTLYFGHMIDAPPPGLSNYGCKQVAAGTVIGYMDDTGFSDGTHLHYELLSNPYGIRLQDLIIGGVQTHEGLRQARSGKAAYPVVKHCFGR